VQARVHSSRGEHAEAERLAREAVALWEQTDGLYLHGDALCDLAEVLEAGARRDEAVTALRGALDCYDRKRIIPLARRTRERLALLEQAPA
jgi:tetratricopeptide (TPR) repeat protein